jgi:transposase, IS30 family
MTYRQLTADDRYIISACRMQGLSDAEIARQVGCHRSTVGREIKRNRCALDGRYRPSKAQRRTQARRRRSRRNRQFDNQAYQLVCSLLREDWSPAQVAGRLKVEGRLSISHETIYRYIYQDKKKGGNLYQHMRHAAKNCRKRYRSNDNRGRLQGKRHISERPAAVDSRRQVGHWEIDTVMGSGDQHCIVSVLERKSGYLLIGKLRNRTALGLTQRTVQLIDRHADFFDTITADNGTEFHDYEAIEEATGVTFYFATPYHSWERGSNENGNGLIRQYLPKRQSMAKISQQKCDAIAHKLNTRPRERLGFKTPEEVFYGK